MKLSKRLKAIDNLITAEYTHIWDCCCDHGFLGAALLSRNAAKTIHFVDIVPELMLTLEQKLEKFYPTHSWKTHCIDVEALPLRQYQGKQLVIIAGVGGDLMIQFINAICQQHQDLEIEFLLCPVHHQFSLRQTLIDCQFGLINEVLVEENKRFYEIIHVTTNKNSGTQVSDVGEKIWMPESDKQAQIAKQYLTKTLSHYQRIQLGNATDVQHIVDAYQGIILT